MKPAEIRDECQRLGRLSADLLNELRRLLSGDDPFDAISVAGDCRATDLAPELQQCLQSSDTMVRWNAASVLFTRFRDTTSWSRCFEMAMSDPDEMVRGVALCGLGEMLVHLKETDDRRKSAELLMRVFDDESELVEMRGAAYEGILAAIDVPPEDRPSAAKLIDLTSDVRDELLKEFRARHLGDNGGRT